ncbi:hypothetical protein GF336_07490 [Candidatus Woesearchaeota archaeon]|nr:hypothetical protein [Candidatus Woesearchaeota archaeon]
MKIKKNIGIILLALLFSAAYVYAGSAGANIGISLISQEPDPADPGEVIDLRFRVENEGWETTDDIIVEFVEKYPFTVYDGENVKEVGNLQGLQTSNEGVILLYKVKVDEDAVQGTQYVDIRYKEGGKGHWIKIEDFPVRVRTRDLVLSVDSIRSEPELVSPGQDFELNLNIKNNADSLIRDITVALDVSDDDMPFAPSTSISEKQVYQINSNSEKILSFDMVALPDAEGGIYKVPIDISYTDETGTSYSKSDIISLKIASSPDLLVNIDNSEITNDKKSGEIAIRIVNKGLTNIKLLTAKIQGDDKFEVLSQEEAYVGNVDSDDYETAEFEIRVKSYDPLINLPLELSYMDSTNKEHEQKVDLELKTHSSSLAVSIISEIIKGVLIIAVIVGGGLFLYRWYKKRKKKKRTE